MSKNSNNNHSIGKYYGYYIYLKECRGVYGDKNTIFQFNEGIWCNWKYLGSVQDIAIDFYNGMVTDLL